MCIRDRTLITRPRISLVVISCTSELTRAKTEISDAPERNSITQLNQTEVERANPAMPAPRQVSMIRAMRPLWRTLPRAATVSAPTMEPTPEAERNKVKVVGPWWKTSLANTGGKVIMGTPRAVMQKARTINDSMALWLRMKEMPCFMPTKIDSEVFC